jgi:hypothetical protein
MGTNVNCKSERPKGRGIRPEEVDPSKATCNLAIVGTSYLESAQASSFSAIDSTSADKGLSSAPGCRRDWRRIRLAEPPPFECIRDARGHVDFGLTSCVQILSKQTPASRGVPRCSDALEFVPYSQLHECLSIRRRRRQRIQRGTRSVSGRVGSARELRAADYIDISALR